LNTIVNLIITLMFTLGSGYAARELLFDVQKTAIKSIDKGLSKSEPFAQKLCGCKLPFSCCLTMRQKSNLTMILYTISWISEFG
jgi:hypothetical protein